MSDQHPWIRRNLVLLTIDFVSFSVGFTFFDPLVILPAFTRLLTGSELLVGALAALRIVFITLPQVFAASVLAASPKKQPLLVWSSAGGRLPVVIMALVTLLFGSRFPWLVVGVMLLAVALFNTSEGLNSITWPDIVGKLLPARIRGRFLGTGQLLSSLGALAAGYLVQRILALEELPFPRSWALLFGCASIGLFGSVLACSLLRERPGATASAHVDVRRSIASLGRYLRADARLRRVVIVEILLGIASSVFAFFVLRAQDLVPQAQSALGTYLIVQNLGGMLAAAICGNIVDHVGSWAAVRVTTVMETLTLALVTFAPLLGATYLVYLGAFALLGFVTGSSWWTFTAYLMDIADEEHRPSYLAASGVLKAPLFVASLLAGVGYRAATPEVLFGLALLFSIAALAVSLTLTRMRAGVPVE